MFNIFYYCEKNIHNHNYYFMSTQLRYKPVALLVVFICSVLAVNAQKLILPAEITPDLLKNICEDAAIKVDETKDTYLKVTETFTIFLDINKDKKFIYLNTSYPLVEGTTPLQAYTLMNKLNREIILIKCYYIAEKNSIYYGYDFWTESGFSNRSLVNAIKMFSNAASLSLQKDTDKLIK